jgi:hypothetical protein
MTFLCDRCLNKRYDVNVSAAVEFQVSRLPDLVSRQLAAQRTRGRRATMGCEFRLNISTT